MKSKEIYIQLFLLLNLCFGASAQSLETYLAIAETENLSLKASFYEFQIALEQVAQAKGLPDPNIALGYFISPIETRLGAQQAKISLSQMFPWFGTLKAAGNAATFEAEAKYQLFLQAKNQLFWEIKQTWYPIIEVKQHLLVKEKQREVLAQYHQLALTGFAHDKNGMVDIIRIKMMQENLGVEIKLLEDQLIPLKSHLKTLINLPDTHQLQIDTPTSWELSKENLVKNDRLFENHPQLQSYDLAIKALKEKEVLAKKNGLPKIGVGLDYVMIGERTDMAITDNGRDALMPMVSLSLPIYRKKYQSAIKQVQLQQEVITYQKTDYQNTLTDQLQEVYFQLNSAIELMQLYKIQTANIQEALRILQVAYQNESSGLDEILKMKEELLKYQIATFTAQKKYQLAISKLDFIKGK